MKQILICDDHPSIRKGIKLILESEFPASKVSEASNAAEVLKKMNGKIWDILILDVDMPGRNGLDVLKQLKDEGVKTPVLVFSMHPEELIAIRAIKLGAAGYLSKDTADEELIKAINHIMLGKKYITASLAEQMATQIEKPDNKAPHELLSDREFQTLLLIAKGKTISKIAEELSLGIPTISTYRSRILEKTGMKNSAELTTYAIRNNLV